MNFAVLELGDAEGDGLGALAGQFFDLLQFLAQLLGVLGLGDDFFRDLLVAVEEMEQFLAHGVDQVGADFGVAELVLGLRFKHRVLEADGDRADHALAHVVALEFALGEFVDRLEQALAKGAQVRAAVAGVLAVDEGEKRLAVTAVAVGETKFERFAGVMERRVNRLGVVGAQILQHQVQQAVARDEGLAVVDELQAAVEVAVMAQAPLHEFRAELRLLENLRVGHEADEGAVRLARRLAVFFVFQFAGFEGGLDKFPAAMAAHEEFLGQAR